MQNNSTNDQQQSDPKRPDLELHSVAWNTVKGTVLGAVIGVVSIVAYGAMRGGVSLSTLKDSPESMKLIKLSAGLTGASLGFGALVETAARNRHIREMQPYIERLEQERDALKASTASQPPTR